MRKNRKATMSFAVLFLVFATVLLTTFALYSFNVRQKSTEENIYSAQFIEDIYAREALINFYTQDMFDTAAKKGASGFVEEFNSELENERIIIYELDQLKTQTEKIIFTVNKVEAEFTITITNSVKKENYELFSANHTYTKSFEAELG